MLQDHVRRKVEATSEFDLSTIQYANERTGGLLTNLKEAVDYLFASIYPQYIGTFADIPSLPITANANDYAVVSDNGDGRSAGYVWTTLDGVEQWELKYDVDWSTENLMADLISQTHPLYVFLNGREGGQHIYGGNQTNENLELNANSADDTGEIIAHNPIRPATDNTDDIGKIAERIKDLYIAGVLTNGSESLTVLQLQTAFDHVTTTGNPHDVNYDELITKLGNLTIDGDVSGLVDLSTSGNKTLTLTVADDSHNHTSSTISDFDTATYTKVANILQDNDIVTYTKDGVLETISPNIANIDTSRITDIDSPTNANRIIASDGSTYSEKVLEVELLGDALGSATYDSTSEKVSINVQNERIWLEKIVDLNLKNLAIVISDGVNPVVNASSHRLIDGAQIYVKTDDGDLDGVFTITYVDQDNFILNATKTGVDAGYYIPDNAQFLYNIVTNEFEVRREFDEISHTELGALDLNDDHLQYARLQGRTGSQILYGSVSANGDLILRSTTDGAKGSVKFGDKLEPETNGNIDLGSSILKVRDIHMSGELKGARLENVASLPTPSGLAVGRVIYNTSDESAYIDTGIGFKKLASGDLATILVSMSNESSKVVDVSSALENGATTSDKVWSLYEQSNNQQVFADINVVNASQIQIILNSSVTGSYVLKGI